MDKQGKYNKADILGFADFSTLQSNEATNLVNNVDAWLLNENPKAATISEEELKIREEVEMDIARGLEEEIKDGICHLALRLQRLYQHQKEKTSRLARNQRKVEAFCEVIISIKVEGGTKIEIKETKKEAPEKGSSPNNWTTSSSRSENYMQPIIKMSHDYNAKKFDWAKTLRSRSTGTGNVTGQRKRTTSSDTKFLELAWKV